MSAKTMAALGLISSLGFGCAEYQVVPTPAPTDALFTAPPAGQSKLCVVRLDSRLLASTAVIHDNGHLVGGTGGESYFCYLAEPGHHTLVAEAERQSAEVEVNAKAGGVYYLKQDVQSGTETHLHWAPMSALEAHEEGHALRYVKLAAHGTPLPDNGAILPASDSPSELATRPGDHPTTTR
jgi:hypothetical protein